MLRVWLTVTSEEQREWLKGLWLSADPRFWLQALLSWLHLVHKWALGAAEDLAALRPNVYLRIPGFGVLHLVLCHSLEVLLETLGQMLELTLSFLFWEKTWDFHGSVKTEMGLRSGTRVSGFCLLVFFEFLPLWFRGYNYKALFVKDVGPPLLSPVCFEAQINWGGQAGALCSLF